MKRFFLLAVMALLTACAATGTVAPQSLDEGLAYATSQVTALEQSAATAVSSGTLKPADAAKILPIADQATGAIKAAKAAESAGDTSTAQGKLALATSLLSQLAAALAAAGVK